MNTSGKSIYFIAIAVLTLVGCTQASKTQEAEQKEPIPDSVYVREGNAFVALTFDTLRNSLVRAIGAKGMDGAIGFCNEKATSLTSAYANDVTIRRTALRFRNPANKPDSLELQVLLDAENAVKSGEGANVRIIRLNGRDEIHYFKPIILQPMCLNCHGAPGEQIKSATLASITKLYPDDQAVNFREGDLRGVWHIIFKSQNK